MVNLLVHVIGNWIWSFSRCFYLEGPKVKILTGKTTQKSSKNKNVNKNKYKNNNNNNDNNNSSDD